MIHFNRLILNLQEEQFIIDTEAIKLKAEMKKNSNDDPRTIREKLIRLMYCEMLGISVPFGYMMAINLMQMKARLIDKRVGYLATSLFLFPNDDLVTLCINSFRRDLQSHNFVEIMMSLSTMTRLLNAEAIPAVLADLVRLASHEEANVRKKTVVLFKRLLQIDMSYLSYVSP